MRFPLKPKEFFRIGRGFFLKSKNLSASNAGAFPERKRTSLAEGTSENIRYRFAPYVGINQQVQRVRFYLLNCDAVPLLV